MEWSELIVAMSSQEADEKQINIDRTQDSSSHR
jgi:hypothetical protein